MKAVGSPKLLFENLDLTPIHAILWTGLHKKGPGRPVEYDPEWDLKALMLKNSLMPWNEFAEKHGDDMEESPYWKWHPPKTIMGRLKARGLIAEGSFAGKDWILTPHELRSLLQAVQKHSEALDESTNERKN